MFHSVSAADGSSDVCQQLLPVLQLSFPVSADASDADAATAAATTDAAAAPGAGPVHPADGAAAAAAGPGPVGSDASSLPARTRPPVSAGSDAGAVHPHQLAEPAAAAAATQDAGLPGGFGLTQHSAAELHWTEAGRTPPPAHLTKSVLNFGLCPFHFSKKVSRGHQKFINIFKMKAAQTLMLR